MNLNYEDIFKQKEILTNSETILNILKNTQNYEDKNHFINLLIEHNANLGQEYIENDPLNLHDFKEYWKNEIKNPAPLFFFVILYLNDDQVAKIIKSDCVNELNNHPQINLLAKTLIVNFFEKGYSKSVLEFLKLKEKKYINFDLTFLKKLEERFYVKTLKNPALLYPYCYLTNNKLADISEKWLKRQLDYNCKKDIIVEFINTAFEKLNKKEQEKIIPYMLYKTKDLDLLNAALKKYGCENISLYKPKEYPLWIKMEYHYNKEDYINLLKEGIDIFDFYKKDNKTFIEEITFRYFSNNLKEILNYLETNYDVEVNYNKIFIPRLFEERVDENGQKFNNFSLLVNSKSWIIIDAINLKIEDLEYYSVKFKPDNYKKLSLKDKIELMNDVVDKTFLAECYLPKNSNLYKSKSKKSEINFNLYVDKRDKHIEQKYEHLQYFYQNLYKNLNDSVYIVDEHLSLLSQIGFNQYDYKAKYFKIVEQMFSFYTIHKIELNSGIYKTYTKIIDYVGTDRTLNWESVKTYLEQEKFTENLHSFNNGGLHLYKYLYKTALSNTLKPSDKVEIEKFKI